MTHTIAPPTLEELNERIDVLEANKVEWADFPNHVHVRKLNIELYCLYAVRDGLKPSRVYYHIIHGKDCAIHSYIGPALSYAPCDCGAVETRVDAPQSPWMARNGAQILDALFSLTDQSNWGDISGDYYRGYSDAMEQVHQVADDLAWMIRHEQSPWMGIETAPKDGTEILLLTSIGVTQARFEPSEVVGDEYYPPVWVCCDDKWQVEVEDCGHNGMDHGLAKYWMPLPAPPTQNSPPDAALSSQERT